MNSQTEKSDFDVNILENALSKPSIELSFPLPIDENKSIEYDQSENISTSLKILGNFVNYVTGYNYNDVYSSAETRFSVNKMSKAFNRATEKYMLYNLEKGDKALDEIVNKLVDSELRMNLIKAKEYPKRFKTVKEFMIQYYTLENKKNLPKFGSKNFLRMCYYTVMKTLSKMFPLGVWVNRLELNNLYQQYLQDPMSIMLLPNHQSHIDYVILHLIFIRFQMSIPVVVAGENLNVAVFGLILKGLGAIFIKRSFNNEYYTEKNLQNYIEFVLLNKINFEVFIEGTRSRDGKRLLPKYGILKSLVSIYLKNTSVGQQKKFDVLMQPISIIYEKVYESEGYLNELIGKDKKQESFFNIMSNGVSNLLYGVDRHDSRILKSKDGFIDNRNKVLHGKIYVKFAENFTLSSFVNNPENLVEIGDYSMAAEGRVNLKKLGFQVLHAINKVSFLPPSAIVGTSIQTFHYLHGKNRFNTRELLPMLDFITQIYLEVDLSMTNREMFVAISKFSAGEKIDLIKSQITKFFKFTRVNPDSEVIEIENSFELLYYKNLGIHLIIHKCLVSFILLRTLDLVKVEKLFYILTGFLKNEFLFDYNYERGSYLSFILQKFKSDGVISENLIQTDKVYHKILCTIIKPFINSFMVCVDNLDTIVEAYSVEAKLRITEQNTMNEDMMLKDYPTTKKLLKMIQNEGLKKSNEQIGLLYHIETYNKQYLLSFLFYLNNLRLIKIVKNKARTEAYVMIKNSKDLGLLQVFLHGLVAGENIDDSMLNYVIDIVDKTFDRTVEDIKAKL